jgi:hypothetical protein
MGRPKICNTKQISSRIPDYLYNIIIQNQEEKKFNTFTESLVDILCGGVNFKFIIDKDDGEKFQG